MGTALSQGVWGMSPQKLKIRGELLTLPNLLPSGAQNVSGPSANEGGEKGGARGRSPLAGGLGGCAPRKP